MVITKETHKGIEYLLDKNIEIHIAEDYNPAQLNIIKEDGKYYTKELEDGFLCFLCDSYDGVIRKIDTIYDIYEISFTIRTIGCVYRYIIQDKTSTYLNIDNVVNIVNDPAINSCK